MMEIAVFYPAIASSVVVIVASYRSWVTTLQMIRLFVPSREHEVDLSRREASTGDDASGLAAIAAVSLSMRELYDYYQRMDIFTRNTVWRMLLTPMMYIGVLIGCYFLIQFGNTFESEILALAIVKVVPALNTVLWIWTDEVIVAKWKNLLCRGIYADTKTVEYLQRDIHEREGSRASGKLRSDLSSNPIRDSSLSSDPDHVSFFNPLFSARNTTTTCRDTTIIGYEESQPTTERSELDNAGIRPERIMSGNEEL